MTALTSIPGLKEALAAIQQGSRDGAVNEDGTVRNTYPDLPLDRELRVVVVEAKYVHSQAGNEGIRYTMEVEAGDPAAGARVWDNVYFTGHPFQGQRLAVLLAAAQTTADSVEEAAAVIVGARLVIALKEGTDPRYPQTRWVNIDQGQKLREGLKPPMSRSTPGSEALSASAVDALIQQRSEAPAAETAPQAPSSAPQSTAPAAPKLPGGIRLPGT